MTIWTIFQFNSALCARLVSNISLIFTIKVKSAGFACKGSWLQFLASVVIDHPWKGKGNTFTGGPRESLPVTVAIETTGLIHYIAVLNAHNNCLLICLLPRRSINRYLQLRTIVSGSWSHQSAHPPWHPDLPYSCRKHQRPSITIREPS